jgi:hypothetical protein
MVRMFEGNSKRKNGQQRLHQLEADALRLSTDPVETNGLLAVSLEDHGASVTCFQFVLSLAVNLI